MFADDTRLFNKNDESVKKSFDILTIQLYMKKPLVQKSTYFSGIPPFQFRNHKERSRDFSLL
jgi:hypothetical protein